MKSKLNLSDKQRAGGRVAGPPVVVLELDGGGTVELTPGEDVNLATSFRSSVRLRVQSVYYPNKQADGPPHKFRIRGVLDCTDVSRDGPVIDVDEVIRAMDEKNALRLFGEKFPGTVVHSVEQL